MALPDGNPVGPQLSCSALLPSSRAVVQGPAIQAIRLTQNVTAGCQNGVRMVTGERQKAVEAHQEAMGRHQEERRSQYNRPNAT